MLAMLNLSMLHKLSVTAERILFEELNVITFMCISGTFVYFVPWCMSLGITLRWKETMGMLNSWPMILACLETRRQRGTKRKAQFGNLSLALKLIALAVTVLIVVLAAASLSILFKNLPVCLLPSKGRGNCAGTASLASFYVAADIPSAGGRSGSTAFGRDGFQR